MAMTQIFECAEDLRDVKGNFVGRDKYIEAAECLYNRACKLAARYRALYLLRNCPTANAVYVLGNCLQFDPSHLLKHDLAFCLGQMGNLDAIPYLKKALEDDYQPTIVRHESAEALAALGSESAIEILLKFKDDPSQEVRETVELALQRLEFVKDQANATLKSEATKSPYDSIDPTPADKSKDVAEMSAVLMDAKQSIWNRYKAMFALRNLNTNESNIALANALDCEDSALLRHEVAYVLGQTQTPLAYEQMQKKLEDVNENCMVRHECAEALGSLATPESEELLKRYLTDKDDVVRESCEVALDMIENEKNGEFHYGGVGDENKPVKNKKA